MKLFCVIYEIDRKRRRGDGIVQNVEFIDSGLGFEYFRVGIYRIGDERDETELISVLGRTANHLVPEGDVYLPHTRGIGRVETFDFVRDIMLYKLINAVMTYKTDSVAVKCDDARFVNKCVCIAKYVRDVRLITQNGRILKNYRSRVFSLYGASVGDNGDGRVPTFDFDEIKITKNEKVFSLDNIIYPEKIVKLIADGVNAPDFAAAVYKYCWQKKYLLEESRPIFSGGMDIEDIILL